MYSTFFGVSQKTSSEPGCGFFFLLNQAAAARQASEEFAEKTSLQILLLGTGRNLDVRICMFWNVCITPVATVLTLPSHNRM